MQALSQMCAKTTIAISSKFTQDRMWLNNKEENINNSRIQKCLAEGNTFTKTIF